MLKEKTTIEIQRADYITSLGLSLKAEFVPFSQSRNKDNEYKSLNWVITLLKNDKEVITTDYMQGIGHAPSYKNKVTFSSGKVDSYLQGKAETLEAETGRIARKMSDSVYQGKEKLQPPTIEESLYALVMDSDVLNYSDFEDWADSVGYDRDSRKGESVYRACLETALKLNAFIGSEELSRLNELFQDY